MRTKRKEIHKSELLMENVKKILEKILFPKILVVFGGIPIVAFLMVYVFAFGHENEPATYIAYFLSAYLTTVFCIWIIKDASKWCRQILESNKWLHRYFTDIPFRAMVSLYLSIAINVLYALLKFGMGMYYHSVWFVTLSVYYVFLTSMRFLLLRKTSRDNLGIHQKREYQKYKICGVIILLLNFALSGLIILVIYQNQIFHYAGVLIYIMAMYTFYALITSITNFVKYRKYLSPVMSASKIISTVSALVSMLSLEIAMLVQFDTTGNKEVMNMMVMITGGAISAFCVITGICMIVHANRKIKEIPKRNITEYNMES